MTGARLLLDTHVFLWWRAEPQRLNKRVREAVSSAEIVFVSAASAWKAAIKQSIGKLRLEESFESGVVESDFERLPVHFSHAEKTLQLPLHHRDPFDRLLAAQSLIEGLQLVTRDPSFKPYDLNILWA